MEYHLHRKHTFNPNPPPTLLLRLPLIQHNMACPLTLNAPATLNTAKEPVDEVVRPDISWIPSYKVFRDRVERLQALHPDRPTSLPSGWPAKIDTARAWAGSDFKSEDEYVLHLSAEDVTEIEAGLAHFKG